MPQTSILIICLLSIFQRQFIVYKNEKGDPTMKMHGKIESRKSHRSRLLVKRIHVSSSNQGI